MFRKVLLKAPCSSPKGGAMSLSNKSLLMSSQGPLRSSLLLRAPPASQESMALETPTSDISNKFVTNEFEKQVLVFGVLDSGTLKQSVALKELIIPETESWKAGPRTKGLFLGCFSAPLGYTFKQKNQKDSKQKGAEPKDGSKQTFKFEQDMALLGSSLVPSEMFQHAIDKGPFLLSHPDWFGKKKEEETQTEKEASPQTDSQEDKNNKKAVEVWNGIKLEDLTHCFHCEIATDPESMREKLFQIQRHMLFNPKEVTFEAAVVCLNGDEATFNAMLDSCRTGLEKWHHIKQRHVCPGESVLSEVTDLNNRCLTNIPVFAVWTKYRNVYSHLRTLNQKVDGIQNEITALKEEVKNEMTAVKEEVKNEMTALKEEVKNEMTALKEEVKNEMTSLKSNINATNVLIKELAAQFTGKSPKSPADSAPPETK